MTTARLRAQTTACGWCDSAVILALDAPIAARTVRLDPAPLDAHQELAARTSGRLTYDLIPAGGHREVVERDEYRIRRREHPVLAAHACPGPVPAAALAELAETSKEPRKEPGDENPQY